MPRPVHFEIHAGDPDRAVAFYTSVFGWKFERWGEAPYWVISTGEGNGIDGGLLPRQGPAPEASAPVHGFVNTIAVTDLDASLDAVTDAGGTLALPKNPVPGVGWLAYCNDTEGNVFGLLQPDESATA
ncbi:VOC family protein [Amycolatopsis sp. SID8362]|uniref:VOC family protein n=1 Tax=Amycolatopsis sp. SID8362 TaxID=2690346 RepID=UPI00136DC4DC|nr:VOC family protein [Amycolatopsis sp. SID8362]NBH09238.1 VOC family protein [Amycolatopsis sp. SID8362]NED45931.1 VOC family protein [Amycolatopsis sp. SID8362]